MPARIPSRIKSLIRSAIGGSNTLPHLLTWLLATAGIDDGMTMYKRFRGSEPKIDALLKGGGLK